MYLEFNIIPFLIGEIGAINFAVLIYF